jgi:hypothetical protein
LNKEVAIIVIDLFVLELYRQIQERISVEGQKGCQRWPLCCGLE